MVNPQGEGEGGGDTEQTHSKSMILQKWREINADKVLCKWLIRSNPKRLLAVIDADGREITNEDCD